VIIEPLGKTRRTPNDSEMYTLPSGPTSREDGLCRAVAFARPTALAVLASVPVPAKLVALKKGEERSMRFT
jgi:hypothetical protein